MEKRVSQDSSFIDDEELEIKIAKVKKVKPKRRRSKRQDSDFSVTSSNSRIRNKKIIDENDSESETEKEKSKFLSLEKKIDKIQESLNRIEKRLKLESESESETNASYMSEVSEGDYESSDNEQLIQEGMKINETEFKTDNIYVTNVYRSKKAVLNKKYNYYFIDGENENDQMKMKKHFTLFLNKLQDSSKIKGIEMHLNYYDPLKTEETCERLLNALKRNVLKRIIQITYTSDIKGNNVKYIKFL